MVAGDLTASTPILATGGTAIKTAIDALNLALDTDKVAVVPIPNSPNQFLVFKVTREV